MGKVSTVFLDIDNTLWWFSRNSDKALADTFAIVGADQWCADYEHFHDTYEVINLELWQQYSLGLVEKPVLEVRRFAHTLEACGYKGNSQLLGRCMNDIYLKQLVTHDELVPGAVELLEYLHGKGYELNVLSNGFKGVQEKKLEAGGMNRYISHVILSEDCGVTKPRKGIYDYAMAQCGCTPDETVMIGDDPGSDIAGALAAGWLTIYLDLRGEPCPDAHHSVKRLLEIKEIL